MARRKKGVDGDPGDATPKSDRAFDRAMKKAGLGDWTKPFVPGKPHPLAGGKKVKAAKKATKKASRKKK